MRLKKIILMTVFFVSSTSYAIPPFKILQSCQNQEAYNSNITYKELDGGYFTPVNDPECDNKVYEIGEEDDEHFQYRSCKKDYLVIHGKDIALTTALDLSVTGVVYPHYLIPQASSWARITYENQTYLCISGPLSQSGYGAANLQYYIIEHAFDNEAAPALYFYFFNKEIHSWISSYEKRD